MVEATKDHQILQLMSMEIILLHNHFPVVSGTTVELSNGKYQVSEQGPISLNMCLVKYTPG